MADGGGLHRVRTALSSQHELVKVHFDDLFSTEAVVATWRRYLSENSFREGAGTEVLVEALRRMPVAA